MIFPVEDAKISVKLNEGKFITLEGDNAEILIAKKDGKILIIRDKKHIGETPWLEIPDTKNSN